MKRKIHRMPSLRACWPTGISFILVWLAMACPARAQTMPELAVSLTGRVRSAAALGTEKMALVTVEFTPPSGSAAASGARTVAFTDTDPELETAPGTELPLDPLERDEPRTPGASRRLRDGQAREASGTEDVPFVLSPSFVRQTVDAALVAQGIAAAFGRLDSLASRARTSAMLPDTRLRAGRDRDQSLKLTPTDEDPYRYTQSGGVSFVVEAAVTWRLGRFLFASEELSIERLRLAQARERQRVTLTTMNELLAWQTAWRRAKAAGERPSNAAEELFESTLRLDVLTDGWFSAHQPVAPPSQPARRASTDEPEPRTQPTVEQQGMPVRVPRMPERRNLPQEAKRPEAPLVPSASPSVERLERLALSR